MMKDNGEQFILFVNKRPEYFSNWVYGLLFVSIFFLTTNEVDFKIALIILFIAYVIKLKFRGETIVTSQYIMNVYYILDFAIWRRKIVLSRFNFIRIRSHLNGKKYYFGATLAAEKDTNELNKILKEYGFGFSLLFRNLYFVNGEKDSCYSYFKSMSDLTGLSLTYQKELLESHVSEAEWIEFMRAVDKV